MNIEHIVLSGGAYKGIQMIGALKYLNQHNVYDIKNIKTIYASSVGSVISLFLCLKVNWDDLIFYLINRPWNEIFNLTIDNIINAFSDNGCFDINVFNNVYITFLKNKGFNENITLKELYDYSKIELHIFSVNLNLFKTVDFSYKTHPNLKVIEAIYMSSSLPLIFKPLYYNNECYLDGGLLCFYPLDELLETIETKDNVLGVRIRDQHITNYNEKEKDNLLTFLVKIINKTIKQHISNKKKIENEVMIPCKISNSDDLKNLMCDPEHRSQCLIEGEKYAKLFCDYKITKQNL